MDAHPEQFQNKKRVRGSRKSQGRTKAILGGAVVRVEQGRRKRPTEVLSEPERGQETGRAMEEKDDGGASPSFNFH